MRTLPRWAAVSSLMVLACAASGTSLANGFAYDDVPIIQNNAAVHTLAAPWTYAQQAYWPGLGYLYRPITVWSLAVQWRIGDGAPWVFHLVNIALLLAGVIAVYALARQVLPEPGAWLAAAVFAVHPVHTEAVANVVGQAELISALAATACVIIYLRVRRASGPISRRAVLAIAALAALSALAKEQGFMVPVLLGAAELTVIPASGNWRERIGKLRPLISGIALALLVVLLARTSVLHGAGGGPPHVALQGLGIGSRVLTMLTIIPEWARLLVWPARLQADYGPPGLTGVTSLTPMGALGLTLLALASLALFVTWRKQPAIAFGLSWCAIALLPVSNVLMPTGVLVAERTLFLPSVGFVLAIAGAAVVVVRWLARWRAASAAGFVAVGALLALGCLRSAQRGPVWHDNRTLYRDMFEHESSYRGSRLYGVYLTEHGEPKEGEIALRHAAALFARDPEVYEGLGQALRQQGRCAEAVPVLERALALDPDRAKARGRLFTCLEAIHDTAKARAVGEEGIARGITLYTKLLREMEAGDRRH